MELLKFLILVTTKNLQREKSQKMHGGCIKNGGGLITLKFGWSLATIGWWCNFNSNSSGPGRWGGQKIDHFFADLDNGWPLSSSFQFKIQFEIQIQKFGNHFEWNDINE